MRTRTIVTTAAALTIALAACTAPMAAPGAPGGPRATTTPMTGMQTPAGGAMMMATSDNPAAALRSALSMGLSEHVALAASATGAALAGRDAQYQAAAAALDANSADLSKAIGSIHGPGAEAAFLPLWRSHIGMIVDYTQGVAAGDPAKQEKAVADLTGYSRDFGAFLNAANPNLPAAAAASLVAEHVLTFKAIVDAQGARNPDAEFTAIRSAYAHMDMIAEPLAAAIAKQKPEQFTGSADNAAADLRAGLNTGLAEHAYLAARATGAALGGRDAEFQAAAKALDANSADLARVVGSVYGADAERAFLAGWRAHIGFFVDYTQGVAAMDRAKQDKAVADLTRYAADLAAFFNSANGLPKDAVQGLVMEHIVGLKTVVDAQAAGNQPAVYSQLRTAMGHMSMVGDPLAEATVKRFPQAFMN